MHISEAVGATLVKGGKFGADMLWFCRDQSTEMHTHKGNHILFVAQGSGYLIFDDQRHELTQGDCYFVAGSVPHKVGCDSTTLCLLSVADDHRPIGSVERSQVV